MAGILEYSKTPSSNTAVNSIGIQGTNSISNFDNAMRQMMADAASAITRHVEKAAGSYTAVKADFNQLWRATGAVTANLTAAATLTDGWCIWLKADGGAITIDPNGSEQINGAATLSLPDGFSAFVVCNGTAFFAIVFGNGDVTLSGTQTLENKALVDGSTTIIGSSDDTKAVRFEVDGLTTATTRVATMPDKDGTVAMLSDIPATVTTPALRIYTSSDTWTKPDGIVSVIVEAIGGGGGSGGAAGSSDRYGAPGGGGGYSVSKVLAASLGGTVSVTIGAGGTAGSSDGTTPGGNGGNSSFGSHCVAKGGAGGDGHSSLTVVFPAAGASAGTGSVMALPGREGLMSRAASGGNMGGGSVKFSPPARSYGWTNNVAGASGGANTGCGAAGGYRNSSGSNSAGAVGGSGLVLVWEFYE